MLDEIVFAAHRINTQYVDVVVMTWQTRKHIGPTFDDVSKPCVFIDDVACADVDADWSGDVAGDCAELLLWLLTGG